MHRRQTRPVTRPAVHVLLMACLEELQLAQLTGIVELLHVKKLASVNHRLHHHVMQPGIPARVDDRLAIHDGVIQGITHVDSPLGSHIGIDISTRFDEVPSTGSFLITPESSGPGLISVVSTKAFASRKQQSRGFLGVMPADYKEKGGAVLRGVTQDGAADRAGLQVDDVVTKLNETAITTHMDMRRFLGTVDPNATVVATITRGEEELEKSIRLDAFPSFSKHAADQMNKSGRRDGFSKVIPHDADLKPANCGGPLFDLDGNFVGLNIARNSRVRSYAIPRAIVKKLVERE